MGRHRHCADCSQWCAPDAFSQNQWRKGEGSSRCISCINLFLERRRYYIDSVKNPPTYECSDCSRTFDSQNNLEMHRQVHRPRNVPCPICGKQRFKKSGANAVQYVESGYCDECQRINSARNQIYQFASSEPPMQHYLNGRPMLMNGGSTNHVPDFPYHCGLCSHAFHHLNQLLQHQDQKHQLG
jgi:DNA-directed RNA polymerase subunit RPC12/RpoP